MRKIIAALTVIGAMTVAATAITVILAITGNPDTSGDVDAYTKTS